MSYFITIRLFLPDYGTEYFSSTSGRVVSGSIHPINAAPAGSGLAASRHSSSNLLLNSHLLLNLLRSHLLLHSRN